MSRRGRPVLGAVAGFFFGVALGVAALVFGVLALDSVVLVVLPLVGILLGVALGVTAPLGGRGPERSAPAA